MNAPKISIIVPVYNAEKALTRCLDSILHQTYPNFELLLINDGSSDKSGAICNKYAQDNEKIKVFHKRNTGVSASRNLGIQNATGEWLCFIDSDDAIEINYLQVFIDLLSKYNADCYITSCKIYSKEMYQTITLKEQIVAKENIYESIIYLRLTTLLGVPWNKLFKTSIIKENHIYFDEKISSYEDEIFVLQYLTHSAYICISPQQTYIYYNNNVNSLSKRYIEINSQFKIADTLYGLGLHFSHKKEYIHHLENNYIEHLSQGIYRLYGIHTLFKRKQRLEIIELIKDKAKERQFYPLLAKNLKRYHFYNLGNPSLLDLNGQILSMYRKLKFLLSHQ